MSSIKKELNADKCTGCSSCVVTCPVSAATSKFLGPKLAGPAFERFRLADLPDAEWLGYCSNCKNCDITCPFGVSVSLLNMAAKGEYCKINRPPLRDWVLSHGELMSNMADFFPNFLVKFAMTNKISRLALDFLGVDKRAPMPVFVKQYFPKMLKARKSLTSNKKIILFSGCYVNVYDPATGIDFIDVLEKAGYEVIVPDGLICCGLPMVSNGFIDGAVKNAEKNYSILKKYQDEGAVIVSLCPTCALMLSNEYDELFPEITEKSGQLFIKDSCDLIVSLIDSGELSLNNDIQYESDVIYHAPCHLRAQGIGLPGYGLLKRVLGSKVSNADAGCCGISGSYGFKKGKYEIGMDIGKKLFDAVKKSGAETASTECGTCRVQITHGSGVKSLHPVSIIKKFLK